MCLYCTGKVSNCSIETCGRSLFAHEGTIYNAYTKGISKLIPDRVAQSVTCLATDACLNA